MPTYSCRAECEHDVGVFVEHLDDLKCTPKKVIYLGMTEWAIEFDTELTIEEIRNILGAEIDTHVMIQTLRPIPLSQNKLDRDHSVSWSEGKIHRDEVILFPMFSRKLPPTCEVDLKTGRDADAARYNKKE